MDLMSVQYRKTKLKFFVDYMGVVLWVAVLNQQKNICINEH